MHSIKMKTSLLTIILLVLQFQFSPAQKGNQKDLFPVVDSLLNTYYSPDQPGIALTIVRKGKPVYTNQMGMANLEYGIPITDSTAFHIASVSKQFTAYAALLLEEEGQLSMQDDVRIHLPELKQLPHKITLRQLANHTHGLPNLFELAQLRGIGIQDRMTHRQVVETLLNIKQINFKPGDQYEYNNTGYVLLAEVIERVSGKPFQTVLEDRIFTPLGMGNTRAVSNSALIVKNKAQSYQLNGQDYENNAFNIMANGSSGISTTIADMGKWAAHFQSSKMESRSIFQTMQEKTTLNTGQVIQYGLGLESRVYKGLDLVFHGGGDAGYRSYILHAPEHEFSIVLLGNANDFAPLGLTYQIVDLFLKGHQTEPLPPQKINYTTQELKSFEGTYEFAPGAYYCIVAENDSLFFHPFGSNDKAPLPVIGDGDFLFPYIPTSKFAFYENGFYFHIADFKYPCPKVVLNPPASEDIQFSDFVGLYKNKEFNTTYEIVLEDDQLVAIHSFNDDIVLYPLAHDSFYAPQGFFGQLDFVRNENGEVDRFMLSGHNLRDIGFRKLE